MTDMPNVVWVGSTPRPKWWIATRKSLSSDDAPYIAIPEGIEPGDAVVLPGFGNQLDWHQCEKGIRRYPRLLCSRCKPGDPDTTFNPETRIAELTAEVERLSKLLGDALAHTPPEYHGPIIEQMTKLNVRY